jgi:anti-anti-sigma factor
MKDVDFIDSSGIGELVRSHMAIRKQGGEMKLAGLSPMVNNLLTATSLNKVFSVERDEASAIKSFNTTGMIAAS